MYVKRDYSEPFFGESRAKRRQRKMRERLLFLFVILLGAAVAFVYVQQDAIQMQLLSVVGLQPTATPRPSDLATRASEAFLAGNIQEAATLYERAVRQSPDNVDYIYQFGLTLLDLNDAELALDMAERIIELDTTDPRGPTLKALAMIWMGQDAAAIPIARAALELGRDYAPLYAALSRAYVNTQNWRDGLDFGERAVQLDPRDANARRAYAYALSAVQERELAIDQLLTAIELQPYYAPPYFELASLYLASDRDQEAIEIYDRILAVQPRNARALLRQCQAYRKIGQFERAIGFCEDAVAADPTYVDAQFQLGALRYNRREFNAALEAFRACVEYDPSNLDCGYRLGLSYYYVGSCDDGWRILQNALVMAQARGDRQDAVENIRQGLTAITSDPNCPAYNGRTVPNAPTPDAPSGDA